MSLLSNCGVPHTLGHVEAVLVVVKYGGNEDDDDDEEEEDRVRNRKTDTGTEGGTRQDSQVAGGTREITNFLCCGLETSQTIPMPPRPREELGQLALDRSGSAVVFSNAEQKHAKTPAVP